MPAAQRTLQRPVVPDSLDFRDRPYQPPISVAPAPVLDPSFHLPVLDQGATNACTGFALAGMVHALTHRSAGSVHRVSPYMLYSMARRYDEFPGATSDTGSSIRGALKGWYRHGACSEALWTGSDMPPIPARAQDDWWLDAARLPLGAYYRVDTRSITDMHVALNETGVLLASAVCHAGWEEGFDAHAGEGGIWTIPFRQANADNGGHAFVIIGYTPAGFIIQNSLGESWGSRGRAILTYEDWLAHAMDCWAAQLGVVTDLHERLATAQTLRVSGGSVQLAGDAVLRARELSPFIVDMENNGRLSTTGQFRTQTGDVAALVTQHLTEARTRWGLAPTDPVDIAVYAHGGLVSEGDAAETAAKWIPALYDAHIFPIFLMWETDLFSTLKNRLEDLVTGQQRPAGGLGDLLTRFWNERLERLLAAPGSMIWGEMVQNAECVARSGEGGGRCLIQKMSESEIFDPSRDRLHLIGHSAGSIVHSHLADVLCGAGSRVDSMTFLAPAVRTDMFSRTVVPHLRSGAVRRMYQFHLTDAAEQSDPTCKPILLYSRSLLCLVSESFEHGVRTPILGMQKYAEPFMRTAGLPNVRAWAAPADVSRCTTHGGFDEDDVTRASVISLIIRGETPARSGS